MPLMTVGRHNDCACTGSALKKAGTGTLQILLAWENAQGEHITTYHSVTPDAWPYTEDLLVKLGWDPLEHDDNLAELNATPSPLLDVRANVVVKEEVGTDGKPRLRASVFPAGVSQMKPEEAREVANTFRANLRAWSSRRSVPRPSVAPSAASPASGDEEVDVPF